MQLSTLKYILLITGSNEIRRFPGLHKGLFPWGGGGGGGGRENVDVYKRCMHTSLHPLRGLLI